MRVIAGQWRGKKLTAPVGQTTRPTADRAKESLFNLIENHLLKTGRNWSDMTLLDGFAGSGAIGIEALSRGAKQVFFVEKEINALNALNKNRNGAGVVLKQDIRLIGPATSVCQIIFLDPPYHQGLNEPTLDRLVQQGWIDEKTLVIVETDRGEKVSSPLFHVEQTRSYGRAQFIFLKKES